MGTTRKKAPPKPSSPRNARTEKAILALRRDNLSSARGWMLVTEDTVSIAEQANGEPTTGIVRLSRRDFNRFVDWYNAEQKP